MFINGYILITVFNDIQTLFVEKKINYFLSRLVAFFITRLLLLPLGFEPPPMLNMEFSDGAGDDEDLQIIKIKMFYMGAFMMGDYVLHGCVCNFEAHAS